MPAAGNRGAASGAGNLKPPVRIYDDADLNAAIPMAAMGIFVHSGHGCVCRSRIFVRRGVYDQVLERIAAVAIMLQPNGPQKHGSHIGALKPIAAQRSSTAKDGVEVLPGGRRLERRDTSLRQQCSPISISASGCIGGRSSEPVVTVLPFVNGDEALVGVYTVLVGVYTVALYQAEV